MSSHGIQAPDPNWCAFHQATFRFFPEAAITPEQVRAGLVQRCERAIARCTISLSVEEEHDWAVSCVARGEDWKLQLDAETGEFWLLRKDPEVDWDGAPFDRPRKFVRRLDEARPSGLSDAGYAALQHLAHDLMMRGHTQFWSALRNGYAHVVARPHSVLSEFSRIPYDAWIGFRAKLRNEDDEPQDHVFDAVGVDGAKLYSVFVAPSLKTQLPKEKLTSAAERKCHLWLVNMMESSKIPTASRDELRAEALTRFRGLSGAAFDRAWREAVRDTSSGWSNPGRRRKTPIS